MLQRGIACPRAEYFQPLLLLDLKPAQSREALQVAKLLERVNPVESQVA